MAGNIRMRRGAVLAAALILLAAAGCVKRPAVETFSAPIEVAPEEVASWSLRAVAAKVDPRLGLETRDVAIPDRTKLVWFGDPPGNRRSQIESLMAEAAETGARAAMTGATPVDLNLAIRQFHAMTPASRRLNLPLGVHDITFDIEVRDAGDGALLARSLGVRSDLTAYSGDIARDAEAQGETQKVRIMRRVAQVVRDWLISGST